MWRECRSDKLAKPRILFVIGNETLESDYLNPNMLRELSVKFQIGVAATTGSCDMSVLPQGVRQFTLSIARDELSRFEEFKRWWVLANRDVATSFRFRAARLYPTPRTSALFVIRDLEVLWAGVSDRLRNPNPARKGMRAGHFFRVISGGCLNSFRIILERLAQLGGSLNRRAGLLSSTRSSRTLQTMIDDFQFSSVEGVLESFRPAVSVIPSKGFEWTTVDGIRKSRKLGIPSLLLVDNWDNLSSKSVFIDRPSCIATWGLQSSGHAVNFHGMEQSEVREIGTPRMDSHQFPTANRFGEERPLTSFPYVLFSGTSLFCREEKVLDLLDGILHDLGSPLKIIYRPHPHRLEGRRKRILNRFGKILIDPSSSVIQQNCDVALLAEPPTIGMLLASSRFVVGGLTSVLLEADFYGKRYIALAHPERLNIYSPQRVFRGYEHYRGIEHLPYVDLCWNLTDLRGLVSKCLFQPTGEANPHPGTSTSREYFLTGGDGLPYSKRLESLLTEMVNR